jgi:respiratory burst oxidase
MPCANAGVLITVICAAMLVTALPSVRSCFNLKWPFELFFSVHHAFIALYILTVAHTLDNVARGKGLGSRSQCGLWLLPPLLLYAFDRFWQNYTTQRTRLEYVKLLAKPKALVIRLARPPGWRYNCGQYARLNVPAVSKYEWHPFRCDACCQAVREAL